MNYPIVKDFEYLSKYLPKQKEEFKNILKNYSGNSTKELISLIDELEKEIISCLKDYIHPLPESLITFFKRFSKRENYLWITTPPTYSDSESGIKDFFTSIIERKIDAVQILEDHILILKDLHTNEQNAIESIQGKLDYIMDKLYIVFNDNFYSTEVLLDLNGIHYRDNETNELAENLCKKGYVITKDYGKSDEIKLTVKGASYVERKRKASNNKKVKSKEEEINKKVDLVIAKLESLGYGQEIIFNEIEELRALSGTLNKKNWVQLLQGKVIDLAIAQVINKETASYVMETLSDGASKLLSIK